MWQWRWRRLEQKYPQLVQGDGGHGPFVEPLFRLLDAKHSKEWTVEHKGALRSVLADRQWTQLRLHSAGKVQSKN